MASKKKKQLPSLKEVFLRENEMSHRYGLDMDTPKGVYVPATTRNKVIAHTAEEPIDEMSDTQQEHCGCGETQGPHIHRVGAPGGPDLGGTMPGGLAPMGGEADLGASIIMVDDHEDDSPYHNEASPGANPDPEQVVLHDNGPGDEEESTGNGYQDPEEDDFYARIAGYYDEPQDRDASDWKPRQEGRSLEECDELNKRKESEDMQFEADK